MEKRAKYNGKGAKDQMAELRQLISNQSLRIAKLAEMEAEMGRLTGRRGFLMELGVWNGSIFFKKDRYMFVNMLGQKRGAQVKVYIGTDETKQREAKNKVERWAQLQEVEEAIAELEERVKLVCGEVKKLHKLLDWKVSEYDAWRGIDAE